MSSALPTFSQTFASSYPVVVGKLAVAPQLLWNGEQKNVPRCSVRVGRSRNAEQHGNIPRGRGHMGRARWGIPSCAHQEFGG